MTQQFQLQPWHIFSGVFLVFWIMVSWFDNFFISLLLCAGGGFAADNLNKFMKGPQGKGKKGDLPKPEVAAAKVEETLVELKESASANTANLIDHLS